MAPRSIRLPPADTILFILTHSQIYWVNFRAHINAEAPAAWHFSSAAETCTRIYTLASWSGFVLRLKALVGTTENSPFSSNHILDIKLYLSSCWNSGVKVWNNGLKTQSLPYEYRAHSTNEKQQWWVVQYTVCHIWQIATWAQWSVE